MKITVNIFNFFDAFSMCEIFSLELKQVNFNINRLEKKMGALTATNNDLDFLQLREQLKEQIRIRNNGTKKLSSDHEISVNNHFGSFFGPSQTVIAQRLIEESKEFMPDLKNLASNKTRISQDKSPAALNSTDKTNSGSKEINLRCRSLQESRDYSFLLSDNAEIPATSKIATEADLKYVEKEHQEEKIQPKSLPSATSRKQSDQQKGLNLKHPKKSTNLQRQNPERCKASLAKPQPSSSTKLNTKQAKPCPEPNRTKVMPNQKIYVPNKKIKHQEKDRYRNPLISSMIQEIIRGKRKHVREDDEEDDENSDDDCAMVSTFADIMEEEERSAKIARKEDEIERLKLIEEEKQERLRRKAKKQKLRAYKN